MRYQEVETYGPPRREFGSSRGTLSLAMIAFSALKALSRASSVPASSAFWTNSSICCTTRGPISSRASLPGPTYDAGADIHEICSVVDHHRGGRPGTVGVDGGSSGTQHDDFCLARRRGGWRCLRWSLRHGQRGAEEE